ncbi:hypothetical protein ILYODFUR_037567, partial [Ilyodon furcidens]
MSVHYVKGQYAVFICSLPGSVKHDTTCNLYFGESSHPAKTTTIGKTKSSETNQWFCRTEIQEDELLKHLCSVQQKEVSCDYSLESDGKSLSPRSDPYSLPGIVKTTEMRITPTRFTKTTGSLGSLLPIQDNCTPSSAERKRSAKKTTTNKDAGDNDT